MRIINHFAMTTLSVSFLLLSGQSFAYEGQHAMSMPEAQTPQQDEIPLDHSQHQTISIATQTSVEAKPAPSVQDKNVNSNDAASAEHIKEHGGQVYQQTTVESRWLRNNDGDGVLKSELETRIGTDENKIFIKLHADQAESQQTEYDAKVLYSRNVADFWDVQAGLRYRNDQNREVDQEQVDAVLGLHGLAPYFFETDAYLLLGQDHQISFSLETERDLLFTQKLILKPYLNLNVVLSDDSNYAQKIGLGTAQLGLETRYEINKKVMPFVDFAYGYRQGNEETAWQQQSSSENEWLYGAGIRFKF
ncbi:copper resistance protein B [Acinetobacter sp.]|uniref:copper resistance protein B n=1 Tax=Acinetobacter sp. TaxID=472 RepID=UPI0026477B21|nr:copper resistance protein B [Acinetobacter sp.]MDN5513264.1 copper resistance protein B [Acinetobacter sp.]MDN5525961.1 copper resistance protein B [Acinetobacter sp.]